MAIVALVGAGAVWSLTGSAGTRRNVDFPDAHPYLCRDCGKLTILSDEELFALKTKARESSDPEDARVPCASCGSRNTDLALKCPRCGEYLVRPASGRPVCPHCKQPFPSLFDDEEE